MADATQLYQFGFDVNDYIRDQYAAQYTEDDLLAHYKPHENPSPDNLNPADVYMRVKDNPRLKEEFMFLYAFNEDTKSCGMYKEIRRKGEETNVTDFRMGKDNKLRLAIKNLGGTKLNFTIEDGRTIVFAPDHQLTADQVKELARFFYMHGIGDDCLQDFRLPENVDNINVAPDPEHPENTTFTKMFDQALKDVNQEYGTDDLQQANEAPAPAPNKPMTLSYRRAEDKIKARMGIMGFKEDLVKMRRCADGSMIISAYTTEDDLADDSKTKNGKVAHKKAFAIKFNIVNGVPEVAAYMPPGKGIEPKHAQCMLEALKSQGCTHYRIPGGAVDMSGAGMDAFWKASAKTMMVPEVDPEHFFTLSPDNIDSMLKQLKEENKQDLAAETQWKENLVEQLHRQEDMEVYKKQNGKYPNDAQLAQFVAQNGHVPASNSKLQDKIKQLEGDIRYSKFTDFTNGTFNRTINKNVQGMFRDTDGKNHNTGKKWDTVDCLAAARAYADLINDYANPNLGYDRLLPDNEAKLMEIFERSRLNYKKSVAIEIQENIANGLRDNEAVTKVAENCRRSVDVSISDVQVSYSDFKVWDKLPYRSGTYNELDYFQPRYKEDGSVEIYSVGNKKGQPVADPTRYREPIGIRQRDMLMQQRMQQHMQSRRA